MRPIFIVLALVACCCLIVGCQTDANAGELSPVQKCGPVQKCPLPPACQKGSPILKCPIDCKCRCCVPVTYKMTLCSRIRLRRAAIKQARCVPRRINVCTPPVCVSVGGGSVGVCVGGICR